MAVISEEGEVQFQIGATGLGITNLRSLIDRGDLTSKPSTLYCSLREERLWDALAVTVLTGLCVAFLLWPPAPGSWKRWVDRLPPKLAYKFNIFCLLIVLGVLPAQAFFRVAYRSEMLALLRHGEYRLAQSIMVREQRLKRKPATYPEA